MTEFLPKDIQDVDERFARILAEASKQTNTIANVHIVWADLFDDASWPLGEQ